MSLFEFDDYREYLRAHIKALPKGGRGELSKIAELLKVNTTWISQIMSGSQDFNFEQTYLLSQYLGHTDLELEFFSLLVQIERAGNSEYRNHLKKKLAATKSESLKLSKRIFHEKKLSEQERSIFYSSWIYSAVHIFTSLHEKGVSVDEVSERFDLMKNKTVEILQFLISTGIVVEKSGKYFPGVQSTFVEQGSPHLLKHHSSWRLKAIQKSENLSETEMMITGQYSISKNDFLKIREGFTEMVKNINNTIKETNPEDIVCLNLDWFWLNK